MKRLFLFAPAMLALAACATSDRPGMNAPPVGEFRPLNLPNQSFASVDAVMGHYRGERQDHVTYEDAQGRPTDGFGDRLLLFSASGYHDDSVEAEQWRVTVDQTDGGYRVVEAGVRFKCARGDRRGEWRSSLCP